MKVYVVVVACARGLTVQQVVALEAFAVDLISS
jgi:hypothetical protein